MRDILFWQGMFAPAATPKAVFRKAERGVTACSGRAESHQKFRTDRLLSLSRTRADDRGGQFLGASGDRALGRSGARKPHRGGSVTLAGQLTTLGMVVCNRRHNSMHGRTSAPGPQQKYPPRGFFVRFPRDRTLSPSLTHAHPTPLGAPPWPCHEGWRERHRRLSATPPSGRASAPVQPGG